MVVDGEPAPELGLPFLDGGHLDVVVVARRLDVGAEQGTRRAGRVPGSPAWREDRGEPAAAGFRICAAAAPLTAATAVTITTRAATVRRTKDSGGGCRSAHFTRNVTAATSGGNSALAYLWNELPYLIAIIVR